MKKMAFCLLIAVFALCTLKLHAQYLDEDKTWTVGLGLDGGMIKGDFKNVFTAGAGINLRIGYQAGPGFITFSSGSIILIPNSKAPDILKLAVLVPFKLGYKLVIADHFFVMGEAGYALLRSYLDDSYGLATMNQGGFVYNPTVGVQFGKVELGLHYQSTSIKGTHLDMPMVRLGINF